MSKLSACMHAGDRGALEEVLLELAARAYELVQLFVAAAEHEQATRAIVIVLVTSLGETGARDEAVAPRVAADLHQLILGRA